MDGNARDGVGRTPDWASGRTARWAVAGLGTLLAAIGLPASVQADPVSPLPVDGAAAISDPRPWISPTGEQLVTYLRQDPGGPPIPGLVARINGGPFSPFTALSARPGLSSPVVGFGADGTALLAWPAVEVDQVSEQTVRPPGGSPEPAGPAGACFGPAALSVSGSGRVISACSSNTGLLPPWTGLAGLGQMPARISPDLAVTPATGEPAIRTFAAWGSNGTGVAVFGYGEEGPPAGRAIAAHVEGPDSAWAESVTVAPASEEEAIEPTGAAVLPNGTAAITADSDEGGVLFVRPPGPGTEFERVAVELDTAAMPSADIWGRLHFLASRDEGAGIRSWWVVIRNLDGSLAPPIPVPTTGDGAEPVANGLQVFPNGAEAIVTRSASGFYIAFRKPGAGAFSVPRRLASSTNAGPGAARLLPQGDVLLTWSRQAGPTTGELLVGGWDSGALPSISRISVPKRVRKGKFAKFSVTASDPMGISRIVWRFPRNRRASGEAVRVRLTKPGWNRVEVRVFDRAGGRSVRSRRIEVIAPRRGRTQGRPGTSGSPRP